MEKLSRNNFMDGNGIAIANCVEVQPNVRNVEENSSYMIDVLDTGLIARDNAEYKMHEEGVRFRRREPIKKGFRLLRYI